MIINLNALMSLPRPEYAKQTEIVLVDLLWRSPGTSIGAASALELLPQDLEGDRATRRLVLEALPGGKHDLLTQTRRWAEGAVSKGCFSNQADASLFAAAALNSVSAPRSRRDRSVTCVPLHVGLVPLQTLNGAVNKRQPPNLAHAVEMMAAFGGAELVGDAGYRLASALEGGQGRSDADLFFAEAGRSVWGRLGRDQAPPLPDWPSTFASSKVRGAVDSGLRGICAQGPAAWFWRNWTNLLDPAAGWRDALPDRRFADWATCVLRTGLALTYLWEGAVFRALRDVLLEPGDAAWGRFVSCFREPRLLAIPRQGASSEERGIGALLGEGLGDAYNARAQVQEASRELGFPVALDLEVGYAANRAGLEPLGEAMRRSTPRDPRDTPKTLQEFVRYLLLARGADDSSPDEADLYYLARTARKKVWVEPGPEWLVVVASLAAGSPGGTCTLQEVTASFRMMGLGVDRATLIEMLEGAGLTQDSPDADEAIVVNAGF